MSETLLTQPAEGVKQDATGTLIDQTPSPTTTSIPKSETSSPSTAPSLLNKDEPKAPAGAPEKYEDFKVPEGFELDEKVAAEIAPIFKDLGLNQAQAQRLVDFYTAKTQESADAPMKLWRETQDRWVNEIKADPEIGGKLDQVKVTVSRAIDSLGDPKLASEFKEAMDYTGAGNNPAFIKAFYKLAQRVTEGTPVAGGKPSSLGQVNPSAPPKSAAARLYPNLA
jgi:hypothetical protein